LPKLHINNFFRLYIIDHGEETHEGIR